MTPSLLTFAQAPASPPFGALTPHVRHFLRNPAGVAGLTLLLLMILMAIFAALLFPGDPLDMVAQPLLRPGQDPQFPLGTDALGRNLLAGLVHGARISLLTGFSAVGISLLIGTLVGTTAGYFGGRIDACLLRLTELFQTIPTFLLVIVLVAIGRPSVALIALSIGLASWPTIARLVRAEFRSLRESDFVLAARSLQMLLAYLVVVSAGTLLAAVASGTPQAHDHFFFCRVVPFIRDWRGQPQPPHTGYG